MPYETDERLKSYLDTNQLHREQMCLAVLASDHRFSNVRPRHPRGGPDGARDVEGVFNGALRVFGAVGFVNQATDSDANKKNATKKFKDDLGEAVKQQPQPEVFVFFTNVNLTMGEKDDLLAHAKAQGLAHAEVFDRERIRLALDNPDGLSIRFQYLHIPLSEAEQATFFARWGDDIQGVIADGFGRVERLLSRIQFLQEANLVLRHFTVILQLDREYDGDEIGHFRAFAIVWPKGLVHGLASFVFGSTDNIERIDAVTPQELAKGKSGISAGICGRQWEAVISDDEYETNADEEGDQRSPRYEPRGSFKSIGQNQVETVRIRYNHNSYWRIMPRLRLQDIDDCTFILALNRDLAMKVRAIHVYANEYKLAEIDSGGFEIDGSSYKPPVPLVFSDEELTDPWVTLCGPVSSDFCVRFSEQTPKRFFHADEVTDSLTRMPDTRYRRR